jgi:methionine-rich copper-binding protein CopC
VWEKKGGVAAIATIVGALLVVVATSGFAAFHTHLKRALPANGAHLTTAPTSIQLWFSERPELAVTTVKLKSARGSAVALGKLSMADASDTAAVVAPVTGTLAPGQYSVTWRVMARDGHPAHGTFGFTIDAPASTGR